MARQRTATSLANRVPGNLRFLDNYPSIVGFDRPYIFNLSVVIILSHSADD